MKYLGLILLVILLAMLNTTKAQTASTKPVSKFYSSLVTQSIEAGSHAPSGDRTAHLPGSSALPRKVKELDNRATRRDQKPGEVVLPAESKINVEEIRRRNEQFKTKNRAGS